MAKIINRVVRTLIVGDLFLNLGWGLVSPVFAIFILENIVSQGPLEAARVAGLAALFYWIPKSLFEIPIGIYLDKHHGEKDDFWVMIAGYLMISLIPLGYLFSSATWHIYLLQTIYALGMALALPSWLAIFTRHIDGGKEAFEWGMESSSIGLGAGIAGGLSGIVVAFLGFETLFMFVTCISLFSTFLVITIRKNLYTRDGRGIIFSGDKPSVEP